MLSLALRIVWRKNLSHFICFGDAHYDGARLRLIMEITVMMVSTSYHGARALIYLFLVLFTKAWKLWKGMKHWHGPVVFLQRSMMLGKRRVFWCFCLWGVMLGGHRVGRDLSSLFLEGGNCMRFSWTVILSLLCLVAMALDNFFPKERRIDCYMIENGIGVWI